MMDSDEAWKLQDFEVAIKICDPVENCSKFRKLMGPNVKPVELLSISEVKIINS